MPKRLVQLASAPDDERVSWEDLPAAAVASVELGQKLPRATFVRLYHPADASPDDLERTEARLKELGARAVKRVRMTALAKTMIKATATKGGRRPLRDEVMARCAGLKDRKAVEASLDAMLREVGL